MNALRRHARAAVAIACLVALSSACGGGSDVSEQGGSAPPPASPPASAAPESANWDQFNWDSANWS